MKPTHFSEPAIEVLKAAKNAGFLITPTTLARWHRHGLIQHPETDSLGKGHGTESLYPAGTAEQLLALLKIRRSYRSLDEVGFRLWLAGYPVAERYSVGYLRAAAAKLDAIVERLKVARSNLNSDDNDIADRAWNELNKIRDVNTPVKFFRKLRKRVGRKNFDTAAIVLLDLVTGNFYGFEDKKHEHVMRVMMGIKKFNIKILDGLLSWLLDSISESLANLSALFAGQSFSEKLALESPASLDDARKEFVELVFGLAAFAERAIKLSRLKLPGFYQLHEVVTYAKTIDLAWFLMVWSRIRRMPWASGYSDILKDIHAAQITPDVIRDA